MRIYINTHTYQLQIYRYTWLMYVSDSSYTLAALHATLQRKNVIPMVYKYVKLCTRLKRKHTFINSTFFLCTFWNHLQRYSPIICLYMDLWDRSFSFMLSKQFGLSLIILLSITNNCFSIVQRLCSKLLLSNISYHFNIEFLSYELYAFFSDILYICYQMRWYQIYIDNAHNVNVFWWHVCLSYRTKTTNFQYLSSFMTI